MQYLNIIFAFAAVVSAIDIVALLESHCDDTVAHTWLNVQPNQCVRSSRKSAFLFKNIPTNWKIITRSYSSLNCNGNTLVNQFHSNEKTSVCHGSDESWNIPYQSAGYSFNDLKRSDLNNVAEQECRKPDLLTLDDGQTYNITGLEDDIVEVMVSQSPR